MKCQTNGSRRLAFQAPQVVAKLPDSEGTSIMNRALASRHSASRSSDVALSKLIGTILRLLLNDSTLYSRVRFPSSEIERRFITSVSLLVRLEDAIWI